MQRAHRVFSVHGLRLLSAATIAAGPLLAPVTTVAAEEAQKTEKKLVIVAESDRPRVVAAEPKVDVRVIEVPDGKRIQVRARKLDDASPNWQGARLGVAIAAEIPESVRAQLDASLLPAGFGVMVQQVEPGSAAAKAGIEPFDILLQFEDQKLVSSQQLIALVGAVKGNSPATISLLRKGHKKEVKVRLTGGSATKQGKAAAKPGENKQPQVLAIPGLPAEVNDLLKQLPESSIQIFGGDGAPFQGTVVMQTSTIMSTDDGTIAISNQDGNRTVTIKNKAGKEIFAGPVNTIEEWKQVPEPFRNQLPKP